MTDSFFCIKMPTSFRENIPTILLEIEKLKPTSVLDIGFGRGKYGFLIKEYYPDVLVDGLEVFDNYVTNLQKHIYNKITIGSVFEEEIPKYDLYLLIDVVEHWDKDKAHKLIAELIKKGKVLVSTPRSVAPQGAEYGNEWERHVSQWGGDDFERYPYKHLHNEISFIYILG